jgi:hypothetical protein
MRSSEIRESLLQTGAVYADDLVGCSNAEIDAYFERVGVRLPASYREYLLAIGHGAGKFLLGTEALFRHLPVIQKEAESLLMDGGIDVAILSGALVFYMHQGYEFGYLPTTESDDPPVYQYIEGDSCPKIAWNSFSEYLVDVIRIFRENMQDS